MCKANIFRTLRPDEIEVRVQQIAERGGKIKATLLLYKNARVDMDMLDEHFSCLGWQREHTFKEGKNYCKVSVYDTNTSRWVSKEDVGIESNTEETKGEASDAFKRACVNFGIGRELYTAPSIAIELEQKEVYEAGKNKNGTIYRTSGWVKFRVSYIGYDEDTRAINDLGIVDANGCLRYSLKESHKATSPMGKSPAVQSTAQQQPAPKKTLTEDKIMDEAFLKAFIDWVHNHTQGNNIEAFIRNYYNVDDDTMRCITNEYNRVYGSNNYPKDAIFLLDLYKESIGMPADVYDYVKGLFNTAFQEGILYQLDKDVNQIKNNIHGNTFQHHRRAEEN